MKTEHRRFFYHGTNARWTEYDLSKNVNQMWGEGIYLTPDYNRAKLYGDNVILTLDVAKARDGRTILYATAGKTKKVGNVNVSSLEIRGSRQNSNFENNVTQSAADVKTKFSVSAWGMPGRISEPRCMKIRCTRIL